ncbi:DUF4124 domain-containing protein [Pseudomonas saudiphocaensis]|uniref:DUF4124 domain-containing protein n=1 Tax=Pseudomonas saudiphocaensis TaxID=1499686 RepID=UPI000F7682C7|nr:DUF4124 domain-containing protein [Pseudomonas saudiphocaensis]RRV18127.1 DUF4124 domain-containing protein [Pseudomonas saudiphocaensis]
MDRRFILLALTLAAADASAAKLNKCVDGQGHVTFTQTTCPGGLVGESIKVGKGGAGMSLGPVGTPVVKEPAATNRQDSRGIDVIGGSACDGGTDQEIRTAIVRRQVYAGMTAKQATQAWGPPGEINRSSSGSDQWVYYRGPGNMQFIYVDQSGCVTGWN